MRWKTLLLALAVAPLAGCLLAKNTARNLVNEPAELHDQKALHKRLTREARALWAQSGQTGTPDFADGFVDGYVDYLDAGGTGQPPAVPPLKYRRSRYMSPEGHALIHDYFCGFRAGSAAAIASGRRDLVTLPILLPEPPADPPVQARQIPAPPPPPGPRELLPNPKPLDGGVGLPRLDRPLAPIRPPTDPPPVAIPVLGGPPRESPPKPADPRSENVPRTAPMPVYQLELSRGVLPPQELPGTVVPPYRPPTESRPPAPWRGD